MYAVGFDPGGKKAFGWAVLERSADTTLSLIAAGTSDTAPDAVAAAGHSLSAEPVAFGTDAPLYWVHAGDRASDQCVRSLVCAAGGRAGTVSHVNSLRGACLVQGVLVVKLAAERWPTAGITEAHPKALLALSAAARDFAKRLEGQIKSEHERDAALAAFSAMAMATQGHGWHDLVQHEVDPFFPCGKPVRYWFPRTRT